MDRIKKAENLPNLSAKKAHLFGGIADVLEKQVARTLSKEVAGYMETHLQENTFYLGLLDQADPRQAIGELRRDATRNGLRSGYRQRRSGYTRSERSVRRSFSA